MLCHEEALQDALLGFTGVAHNKCPQGRLAQLLGRYEWLDRLLNVDQPVLGLTMFTDAGRKMKRAACAWKENDHWKTHTIVGELADSLQTFELGSMIWALQQWSKEPMNVVSDSLYVIGEAQWIHDAEIWHWFLRNYKSEAIYPRINLMGQAPKCLPSARRTAKEVAYGKNAAPSRVVPITSAPERPHRRARRYVLPKPGELATVPNWCSYTVTQRVSCHVQNGTFLQRVSQSCCLPLACSGSQLPSVIQLLYRVAYRTLTVLEWWCCPGHARVNCKERGGAQGPPLLTPLSSAEAHTFLILWDTRHLSSALCRPLLHATAFSGCLNCSRVRELTARLATLKVQVARLAVAEPLTPAAPKGSTLGRRPEGQLWGSPATPGMTVRQGYSGHPGPPARDGARGLPREKGLPGSPGPPGPPVPVGPVIPRLAEPRDPLLSNIFTEATRSIVGPMGLPGPVGLMGESVPPSFVTPQHFGGAPMQG
ncbi:EMI domain-containing protein 1-like [Corvus moneduloides]|uniref:EMI domain-containing protein 1-like n=1 Tax=Corvus moneduloides TaxID=1196302 RepID=UPI00136282C1|nr:EMI domain-containing protein 1-like [Corvus moneduloides]